MTTIVKENSAPSRIASKFSKKPIAFTKIKTSFSIPKHYLFIPMSPVDRHVFLSLTPQLSLDIFCEFSFLPFLLDVWRIGGLTETPLCLPLQTGALKQEINRLVSSQQSCLGGQWHSNFLLEFDQKLPENIDYQESSFRFCATSLYWTHYKTKLKQISSISLSIFSKICDLNWPFLWFPIEIISGTLTCLVV